MCGSAGALTTDKAKGDLVETSSDQPRNLGLLCFLIFIPLIETWASLVDSESVCHHYSRKRFYSRPRASRMGKTHQDSRWPDSCARGEQPSRAGREIVITVSLLRLIWVPPSYITFDCQACAPKTFLGPSTLLPTVLGSVTFARGRLLGKELLHFG